MNHCVIAFRRILLAASIAMLGPLPGQAQPIPGDLTGSYWSPLLAWHCEIGCGMPLNGGVDPPWLGPSVAGPEDAMPPIPMLRGLALSEAQRDKVFMIFHTQARALRQTVKAARRAYEDLQQLTLSAQFDQATAKSLAETYARSIGALELLRSEGAHGIYAVLTEEQRQQLQVEQRPFRRD